MKILVTFLLLSFTAYLHAQITDDDSVFTTVEFMPEFPGGQAELLRYMASIPYPMKAKENDIQGKVILKFVVDSKGKVTDVEVAKSSGNYILDSASVAHVQNMPDWKPGMADGKFVKVQYAIPINFVLEGLLPQEKEKTKKRE